MKNIMKLHGLIAPADHVNYKINYTLYDVKEEKLVSTDTSRLLVTEEIEADYKDNILIKTSRIKKQIEGEGNYNLIFEKYPALLEEKVGRYPDYQRIVPPDTSYFDTISLEDKDIDEVLQVLYNHVLFNYKFIEELFKCKANLKEVWIDEKNPARKPFVVLGEVDDKKFKYVIMPKFCS